MDRLAPSTRHQFVHDGKVIYEWDQTLQEVNMYVDVPPGVTGKHLTCSIGTNRLAFGLKEQKPFLDQELFAPVKQSESFWTLEDGTLHINLTKLQAGQAHHRHVC